MEKKTDYTFKYNANLGRHGWLRLTPAYSVKLVEEILGKRTLFSDTSIKSGLIFDPFCGTATTGIVSAERGLDSYLYEINPFLHWFAAAKSANYDSAALSRFLSDVRSSLLSERFSQSDDVWIPPMKNISRWWSDETLRHLGKLHEFLRKEYGLPVLKQSVSNLAWIAFSRLAIETSAADYGHISVSFKDSCSDRSLNETISLFINILETICRTAEQSYSGSAHIIRGDSRDVVLPCKINYVITSPPYPNRISYIRELRPYMYWLGFLSSGEQAGDLDWAAIGGTWGSATSKLLSWKCDEPWDAPEQLTDAVSRISAADAKNGRTMAQYVLKFFYDMYLHFKNLRKNLAQGCELYYVLGNSSFYGNMVHTDVIVCEMMRHLGYTDPQATVIRKRNSKKELYEFMISSRWKGECV